MRDKAGLEHENHIKEVHTEAKLQEVHNGTKRDGPLFRYFGGLRSI